MDTSTRFRFHLAFAIGAALWLVHSFVLPPSACAQPTVYSEDFSDGRAQGWQLEPAWQVRQNALSARGHGWARYPGGTWEDLSLSFLFHASNKGLQANVRMSDAGRYGVGFSPERNGLDVYLFKETAGAGGKPFRELARERIRLPATRRGLRAEIVVKGDAISVSVNGVRALSARDRDPLPPGMIGFESMPDSTATVDDVTVRAERAMTRVPGLIGRSLVEARERLNELHLVVGQTREQPSDAKAGLIVDQHPAEGEQVVLGSAVRLVVSLGSQQVDVPRLIGRKRGEAIRAIRDAGLKVGAIHSKDSDHDNVVVVDQDPRPGSKVANGSPVSFTVGMKESDNLVDVPSVVDRPLQNARSAIEAARLSLGEVTRKVSDAAVDKVLEQQPKGGARAPAGSAVRLWISSGAHPAEAEVPRLIGRKRDQADILLNQAGLTLGAIHEKAATAEPGTVVEQDPVPGARVQPRSPVHIWVSSAADLVSVPNVLNQDKRSAQSMLESEGLLLGEVAELRSNEKPGTVLSQAPTAGQRVPRSTPVSITLAAAETGSGWLFPAVLAGTIGVLAGYLGACGFKRRERKGRQRAAQITVRTMADPGDQTIDAPGSILGKPVLRCKIIPDKGKQQLIVPQGTSNEDEHAG